MAELTMTPQQRAAVTHRGGTLLVSAAAGSGKTMVLVQRLMGFLCDPEQPAEIDQFLVITYTKAAAAELRSKISEAISSRLTEEPGNRHLQRQLLRMHAAQISTVHAFCTALLREYAHLLGLSADFRVLEQNEADELRAQILERALQDAYELLPEKPEWAELFDTLGAGRDDRALGKLLQTLYDQVQCHRAPENWAAHVCEMQSFPESIDAAQTPWGAYLLARLKQALTRASAMLELACKLMQGNAALEAAYLPCYRENLADLESLQTCETWKAVFEHGKLAKGRVKPVKNFENEELLEQVKQLRSDACALVEKAYLPFRDTSEAVLADQKRSGKEISALFEVLALYQKQYAAEKQRLRVLDFSDLEQNALKLLCTQSGAPTAVAKTVSARFREIMVDEYQDTNEVQDAIFAAVSHQNRFLVGDVKQSIYRFRLADPSIFLEKYRDYPMHEEEKQQPESKILLSQNFRSQGQILSAVNDVFRGVMSETVGELNYSEDEMLRLGRQTAVPEDSLVELHCLDTEQDEEGQSLQKDAAEAAFVASRILQMLRDGTQVEDAGSLRQIRAGDIVILMRSPRSHARAYLEALQRAGIPALYEQSGNLLDTVEVQLLRCMLQVVDNPRQDIPLAAVLLSPLFSFSASELAQLRAQARDDCLFTALLASEDEKVIRFRQTLEQLRLLRPVLPLPELTQTIVNRLELVSLLRTLPDGEARIRNLRTFTQYIENVGLPLTQLLERLKQLEAGGGLSVPAQTENADAVRIMSVHSSKGLEFPVVFLAGLSVQFNMDDLRAQLLTHPKWGAAATAVDPKLRIRYPTLAKQVLQSVKEMETKSEEMRVLYVAMTRARERLIMVYTTSGLERHIKKLASETTYPLSPEVAQSVSCPGDWVLYTALSRMDAGALHTLGRPAALRIPETNWKITLQNSSELRTDALPSQNAETGARKLPSGEELRQILRFSYPYAAAERIPAKLTATQLKGRALDEEMADGTPLRPERKAMKFPMPDFAQLGALSAAQRGTAMHLFMQYANYASCETLAGIQQELLRLRQAEFLTAQQADAVDCNKLYGFFASAFGQRVLRAKTLLREFKFSLLVPANEVDPNGTEDEVLLQGVVDCCLNEPEGLTILDFKTDHILPGGEAQRAAYYWGQLQAYARALARIFQKPVLHCVLYFFATGSTYEMPGIE